MNPPNWLPPFLLLFACLACASQNNDFPDPDELPYTLEPVVDFAFKGKPFFTDLDGDGRDDIVTVFPVSPSGPNGFIHIRTPEGEMVDQVNFAGEVRDMVHFLDYDDDGSKEIFVPFVRDDSLFVSVVTAKGDDNQYRSF